ncbi:hypothetical protein Rxycam_01521 [Rubrobacter xylanophilus DSM 9941]|uniref:DUF2255 family protein n=1 Tax=Rubrobacter xylanophilus TaxID=49319 RepID=UPI001C63B864|nr:DUF2255 family protein [Rubrobacter xylanophilus]QYJ15694.1 hypothetical protein Rxycam_01521 [Rubrobacter xylanophilus DSM 9941]
MSEWTDDELDGIGGEEEIEISPLRRDGSPGKAVPVWVVRVGDDLYVRSWRGRGGGWYRTALATGEGRIRAGGVEKQVGFVEEKDPAVNDRIDAAYREKYGRYPAYVRPMIAPEARATTLRLVPRP